MNYRSRIEHNIFKKGGNTIIELTNAKYHRTSSSLLIMLNLYIIDQPILQDVITSSITSGFTS